MTQNLITTTAVRGRQQGKSQFSTHQKQNWNLKTCLHQRISPNFSPSTENNKELTPTEPVCQIEIWGAWAMDSQHSFPSALNGRHNAWLITWHVGKLTDAGHAKGDTHGRLSAHHILSRASLQMRFDSCDPTKKKKESSRYTKDGRDHPLETNTPMVWWMEHVEASAEASLFMSAFPQRETVTQGFSCQGKLPEVHRWNVTPRVGKIWYLQDF